MNGAKIETQSNTVQNENNKDKSIFIPSHKHHRENSKGLECLPRKARSLLANTWFSLQK